MPVLVTGANGFVGSHLVDALLRDGAQVRALVRRSSDLRFLDTSRVELAYCELEQGEIPSSALQDAEAIFHVAARLKAPDPKAFRRVNVDAASLLYRTYAEHGPAGGRFVFVSSLAAAGPASPGGVNREGDEPNPQTPYGRSKLEAEQALAALEGPPLTVIRPPAVYGERDRATLPLFTLAAHGWAFCVGSSQRQLSMIHVSDLAAGILAAWRSPAGVGTFYLTDGQAHSWKDVALALRGAAGRRVRIVTLPDVLVLALGAVNEAAQRVVGRHAMFGREKARDFCAPSWSCSSEAAARAFGYAPRTSLAQGMRQTMNWYREQGWL